MEGLPKNCQGAPHTTPGRRRLAKYTRFNWDRRKACKMALERHSHGPVLETQVILFYLMLSGRNRVFREFRWIFEPAAKFSADERRWSTVHFADDNVDAADDGRHVRD